jgi:hypothetical protein
LPDFALVVSARHRGLPYAFIFTSVKDIFDCAEIESPADRDVYPTRGAYPPGRAAEGRSTTARYVDAGSFSNPIASRAERGRSPIEVNRHDEAATGNFGDTSTNGNTPPPPR